MATGPTGDIPNAFVIAPEIVQDLKAFVTARQEVAIDRAFAARESASGVLDTLANYVPRMDIKEIDKPVFAPSPRVPVRGRIDLPSVPAHALGVITPPKNDHFVTGSLYLAKPEKYDPFKPMTPVMETADAPQAGAPLVLPDVPQLNAVSLPSAPGVNRPSLPDLVDLVLPTFTLGTIPPFTDAQIDFQASDVTAVLQWSDAEYVPVILEEEMAVLRRMWAGGTGLPQAVEDAMWERAASREDTLVLRDVSAAMTEFAGRGFSMPPGMLVSRIDAIRTEGMVKKQALGREVLIKIADTHIENLRFACTTAIASENMLVSIWSQMAQRSFEAAKIQLESEIALLNAQIAIFNARQIGRAQNATIHRIHLEMRTLELQEFKARIDGEIAKGQINDQRLKAFLAQYEGVKADIELFKGEMQGAQLESEFNRNLVERYKSEVMASAEVVKADRQRFDEYDARVKNEIAKGSALEAEAKAYAAYLSGKKSASDIEQGNQAASLAMMEARLKSFMSNLDADKLKMQFDAAQINASGEHHRSQVAQWTASANVDVAKLGLEYKNLESDLRTELATFDFETRKYIADLDQMTKKHGLQIEALKAVGQAHSTLAAGAMAGISLSASIGGDAKVSASGSTNIGG